MYGWSVGGVWLFGVGLLLSRIGALRSFTTATFFKRAPLQMSDSRALRPLLSSLFSCGGLVLALGGTLSISNMFSNY